MEARFLPDCNSREGSHATAEKFSLSTTINCVSLFAFQRRQLFQNFHYSMVCFCQEFFSVVQRISVFEVSVPKDGNTRSSNWVKTHNINSDYASKTSLFETKFPMMTIILISVNFGLYLSSCDDWTDSSSVVLISESYSSIPCHFIPLHCFSIICWLGLRWVRLPSQFTCHC